MSKTFELAGYNYSYLIPAVGLGLAVVGGVIAWKTGQNKVLFAAGGLVAGMIAGGLIKKPTKIEKKA
jgi:hypothetical protein